MDRHERIIDGCPVKKNFLTKANKKTVIMCLNFYLSVLSQPANYSLGRYFASLIKIAEPCSFCIQCYKSNKMLTDLLNADRKKLTSSCIEYLTIPD